MATKSTTVKLGKEEIELKYTIGSIILLDEKLGINLYASHTYNDYSPRKLRDLVWAGQLYRDDPLSVNQVGKLLPTDIDAYGDIAMAISEAIRKAISKPASE